MFGMVLIKKKNVLDSAVNVFIIINKIFVVFFYFEIEISEWFIDLGFKIWYFFIKKYLFFIYILFGYFFEYKMCFF